MSPTSSVRSSTIRFARGVAAARRERLCKAFEDSLAGDLARLQVWRRIRHEFPGMKPDEIDALIEELLTP